MTFSSVKSLVNRYQVLEASIKTGSKKDVKAERWRLRKESPACPCSPSLLPPGEVVQSAPIYLCGCHGHWCCPSTVSQTQASPASPLHPQRHFSPQLSLLPVHHSFSHSHLLSLPLILLNSLNLLLLSKLSVSLSVAHTNTYDLLSHWSSSLSVAFQNPQNLLWT